jgi:hypothetical protein
MEEQNTFLYVQHETFVLFLREPAAKLLPPNAA